MLNILGMIILIIILFIIILLYIGVKISLDYEKKDSEIKGCLKILILRKIKVYSLSFPGEDDDEEEEEEESEGEGRDYKKLIRLARPCFGDFKIFLKSFLKCIRVKKLKNHLIFGLDSYTDTAKYIGYIWAMLSVANNAHKNARLSAEPCFNGSTFDAAGVNEFEINVLKLIPPILRLISKKEVIQLIRGVLNG